MIASTAQIDGAILVVSAQDNPEPQTKEQLLLARQVGVHHIVVALTKVEVVGDRDALELTEFVVRGLLTTCGYPGDDVPVVRVSALKALEGNDVWSGSIVELVDACDTAIPEPELDIEKPFLMSIQDVVPTTGHDVVVTGRVERGRLKPMDEVEIVGIKERSFHATVTGIEFFGKALEEARAGEICRLLLRDVRREDVEPGMVVVEPGTASPHTEATVYMLSREEGGRYASFFSGYRPWFYFRSTEITGVITLPEGTESVMPGDNITITVKLLQPVAMEEGLRCTIRDAGRTVGAGCVIRPL